MEINSNLFSRWWFCCQKGVMERKPTLEFFRAESDSASLPLKK